jgi:ketosteroid isomerase-like protein
MKTEESRALVIEAWSAFASRNASRIAQMFADDVECIAPQANGTAQAFNGAAGFKGAEAIASFIAKDMRRLFLDLKIDFRGFYADGPIVVVEERMTASLPDGARYENDYCFVFECRYGKIARVREYMDTLNGYRQLFRNGPPLRGGTKEEYDLP